MEDIVISEKTVYIIRRALIPLGILLLVIIWQYRSSNAQKGAIAFLKTGSALALALTCQSLLHEYIQSYFRELTTIALLSYLAMTSTLMLAVKTGIIALCRNSSPNFGRVFIEATLALWISDWLLFNISEALGEWPPYFNISTMILLFCLLVTLFFMAIHKTINWILATMSHAQDETPLEHHHKAISWLIVGIVSILPLILSKSFILSTDISIISYNIIETYTFTIPLRLFML